MNHEKFFPSKPTLPTGNTGSLLHNLTLQRDTCIPGVNYCIQEYLGTQVSTDIRQPDFVFSKNVLIHLFSFWYSVAANNALKNESSAWAAAAATPPTACSPLHSPSKPHTELQWWQFAGEGSNGWTLEVGKVSQVHFTSVNPNCAKPTQPTKQTQAGCETPKFGVFS